jgi:hypothetical protein
MTDSIPLTELGSPSDNARRDYFGRYLVVPPEGGTPPVPYTRVTTVAGTLDSLGGLAPWKATMCAQGMLMRRGLRARWEALLAEYGDAWYGHGAQTKKLARALVEECAAVGGGNDRKEQGSALHTLTALADLGRMPKHLTPETERDVLAYLGGRQEAGIEVVPGLIEVTVVIDAYQVAGTFDRGCRVPGFDLPLISDLKTGATLEYSFQEIAVQLAAYSRANAIYRQGPAADGSDDVRLPMPAVDQDWGLIFWLPADEGNLHLYLVDLQAGWEAFEKSMWTRGWRKAKPQREWPGPVPTSADNLLPALEASLAAAAARHPSAVPLPPQEPPPAPEAASVPEAPSEAPGAAEMPLREWLQGRINAIGEHPQARSTLGRDWPQDIPTLRRSEAHSAEDLAVIEQLCDAVERRWQLTFPPPRPGSEQAMGRLLDLFPGSSIHPDQETPA